MSSCFKCKQGVGTVASRDGPRALYCADCFLSYCGGVVRDGLFQQCCLAANTPVAVAVSGGPNSMLLLRELGQLRRKMQDQCRRTPRQQQQQHRPTQVESGGTGVPTPAGSSGGSSLTLLPFHLCEAELILPPSPTTSHDDPGSSTQSAAAAEATAFANARHREAAAERVRASMQDQFDTLLKLVSQQPPRWVHHDEAAEGKKRKQKMKKKKQAEEAAELQVSERAPAHDDLFRPGEVRIVHYSDFLLPAYLEEVRHALHASKLSLTDREALYDRVRQQVLCRATKRLIDDYRVSQRDHLVGNSTAQASTGSSDAGAKAAESTSAPPVWYHLLVGSNAARCAGAALEAVVSGAGGDGIVHTSAFRGVLHDVVCLRPMRMMLPKETVLCSRLHGITATYTPALRTETGLRSMRQVIESFVHTMILSFRTMIFNVLNTVQRLKVHPDAIHELVHFAERMGEHQRGGNSVHSNSIMATPTSLSSTSSGQRGHGKALPGRTAQQNERDLITCRPPMLCHTPSSAAATAIATAGSTEGKAERIAVQCCLCGCPSSMLLTPADDTTTSSHVEMLALTGEKTFGAESGEVSPRPSFSGTAKCSALDCFVCYGCRSLLGAWPASALAAPALPSGQTDLT